jgi:hypothetical protein
MRDQELWRELRALRANPPGFASSGARRAVFGAALQQSQELMTSAQTSGPASKPLALFYALSQAGRAVAAAHAAEDEPWQISGHGLAIAGKADNIGHSLITPTPSKRRSDAYGVVARAIGSAVLESPVTLSTLWAAIPELMAHTAIPSGAQRPLPLAVAADFNPKLTPFADGRYWTPARAVISDVQAADVPELLAAYAHGAEAEIQGWSMDATGGIAGATVTWRGEGDAPGHPVLQVMENVAIETDTGWYLQPLLGEPPASPAPLMNWWALLIALSSLARYHPGVWADALDVDRSAQAVELEECLELAERCVAQLVLQALSA